MLLREPLDIVLLIACWRLTPAAPFVETAGTENTRDERLQRTAIVHIFNRPAFNRVIQGAVLLFIQRIPSQISDLSTPAIASREIYALRA